MTLYKMADPIFILSTDNSEPHESVWYNHYVKTMK